MTLLEAYDQLTHEFRTLKCPALEARQLLQAALSIEYSQIITRGEAKLNEEQTRKILQWRDERLRGVPLAYLSGRKGFYKYEFLVEPGVLIPRPETEFVVEVALNRAGKNGARIADLGCGSGCIGLTLLKEIPDSSLVAVDLSEKACEVTLKNRAHLGLENRAEVVNSRVDNYAPEISFTLIVANPPYIGMGDPNVEPAVHAHEPHLALYSGPEGLDAIRAWTTWSFRSLAQDGVYVMEIGAGQSEAVREIMKAAGFTDIQTEKDLAGHERVISGRKI